MEYSFDINSEIEKFELYYLNVYVQAEHTRAFILFIHQKCKGSTLLC